jgi:hypothetical protein
MNAIRHQQSSCLWQGSVLSNSFWWEECRIRFFENRVLTRIFGPKKDEVTGEWRRIHNEELYALYSSPNIIWVIKSRPLRWAGHVASIEVWREERCIQGFSGET